MAQLFSWQILVTSNFLCKIIWLLYPLPPFSRHFLNCQTVPMYHNIHGANSSLLSCLYVIGPRIQIYIILVWINYWLKYFLINAKILFLAHGSFYIHFLLLVGFLYLSHFIHNLILIFMYRTEGWWCSVFISSNGVLQEINRK